MIAPAIICSLLAWFVGLLIDANIGFEPAGFLMLRVILLMIVLGGFILASNKDHKLTIGL